LSLRSPAVAATDWRNWRKRVYRRGPGVWIVVNPGSGAKPDEDLISSLRSALPLARIAVLGQDDKLGAALGSAADDCDALGIAGGDGSVALAAAVVLERDVPLLVIPAGTLNHLASTPGRRSTRSPLESSSPSMSRRSMTACS
jgi:NAD kinase